MNEKSLDSIEDSNFLRKEQLEAILIDLFDIGLYNKLKAKHDEARKKDIVFFSNRSLWKHILKNKSYEDQYISLDSFYLTEWLPMSPGLFHTKEAKITRKSAKNKLAKAGKTPGDKEIRTEWDEEKADGTKTGRIIVPGITGKAKVFEEEGKWRQIYIYDRETTALSPEGNMNMVNGGVGCLRLKSKNFFDDERLFLLGASSTGICHEGIPVMLPSNIYSSVISQIKENCGVKCKLIGRLRILPTENSPIRFDRKIPKYCLLVEELKNIDNNISTNDIFISIAITYTPNLRTLKEKYWSFVSFHPDKTDNELAYSIEWLYDYAIRNSGVDEPIILAGFDEYKQHFKRTEFSIEKLANGKFDIVKLAEYGEFLNLKIVNIMGDKIENIQNSTIINRSTISSGDLGSQENNEPAKDNSKLKDYFKTLISQGKIEKCINELIEHFKIIDNREAINSAILQSSNFMKVTQQLHHNIVDNESANISFAKINDALLHLIDKEI